jgi:hypothetical protein
MLSRNQRIWVGVTAVAASAGIVWTLIPGPPPPPPPVNAVAPPELLAAIAEAKPAASRAATPATAAPVVDHAETIFERIGLNTLHLNATNKTARPVQVSYKAGDVFDGEKTKLVLLKSFALELQPGGTEAQDLPVAAIRSSHQGETGRFTRSSRTQSDLAPLIRHLESNPSIHIGAVQAAVLAITEDAPVDLFARFPRPDTSAGPGVESFKIDTVEIIAAIQLLRDIHVESCKLSADPQLKVEAMIDPAAHASAMKYYGIDPDSEWLYWRNELLEGDPSTRHYALYGIARFYPDVALQMMPKWALEQRTAPHYRRAAIGALALTRKSEAGPILRALERDLAQETDLVQMVDPALRYLEQNANDAP